MRSVIELALANAIAATVLALLALMIGQFIRRPAVRHVLWVLVLVRLLLPPMWTVPLTLPAAVDDTPVAPSTAVIPADTLPVPISDATTLTAPSRTNELDQPGEPVIASPPASSAPIDSVAIAAEAAPSAGSPSYWMWTALVWLLGTLWIIGRSAGRIVRFQRGLRDASPAPRVIQRQAAAIGRAMGLRQCPAILLVPGRVSPALWMPGLRARTARLLLPSELLPKLDSGQRATVIAHELAHLRRGDPWIRWLELLVIALYWWFPPLAWFRRQLRAAEEECCDLWVVAALRERRDYATALVETAAFLGESGPAPHLASGAAPVRNLQRRVTMIMRATWPARLTRVGLATVLGVSGLGLAFGPALAQEREGGRGREEKKSERGDERKDPGRGEERKDPGRGDERAREPVRERGEGPGRGAPADIEKARSEVERARKLAHEAMMQLRAAEETLAKLEGRPVPRDPFGEREPGERGRRVDLPAPPGVPADPRGGPMPPGGAGRSGPGGDFRELQQQVEELRRALDQMRQELRDGRGNRKEPEAPRGGPPPRERGPKDEPKRPGGEPPERREF